MSIYKTEEGKKIIDKQYDTLLSKWKIPFKSHMVSTRFGQTHIMEMGDGDEIVVLLHGSTSNNSMWINEVESLKSYKVLAIDLPGEPNKSTETRLPLDDNSFADWLHDCMAHYNQPKFHLIGNSLGGWVALKYGTVYNNHLSSLSLIAPSGIAPARISFMFKAVFYLALGKNGIKKLAKTAIGRDDVDEEVIDVMVMMMKHFNPRMGSLPVFDDLSLKNLKMPILYLGGNKDQLLNTKKSARRLELIGLSADVRTINSGHAIYNIGNDLCEFITNRRQYETL